MSAPKLSTIRVWAQNPDDAEKPDVLVAIWHLELPELHNVRIELERPE